MRLAALTLVLVSGCSLARTLSMPNSTPKERETVYAVVGTFVVMATVAALITAPAPENMMTVRPMHQDPLGL